jgi:hypothetical protein
MNKWQWQLLEEPTPLDATIVGGIELKAGDRVRLRPHVGRDAFDLVLAGRTATVKAIEQDYENKVHVAVLVDDNPGKDLGLLRQPGHRFFFRPEEIEPLRGGEISGGSW